MRLIFTFVFAVVALSCRAQTEAQPQAQPRPQAPIQALTPPPPQTQTQVLVQSQSQAPSRNQGQAQGQESGEYVIQGQEIQFLKVCLGEYHLSDAEAVQTLILGGLQDLDRSPVSGLTKFELSQDVAIRTDLSQMMQAEWNNPNGVRRDNGFRGIPTSVVQKNRVGGRGKTVSNRSNTEILKELRKGLIKVHYRRQVRGASVAIIEDLLSQIDGAVTCAN